MIFEFCVKTCFLPSIFIIKGLNFRRIWKVCSFSMICEVVLSDVKNCLFLLAILLEITIDNVYEKNTTVILLFERLSVICHFSLSSFNDITLWWFVRTYFPFRRIFHVTCSLMLGFVHKINCLFKKIMEAVYASYSLAAPFSQKCISEFRRLQNFQHFALQTSFRDGARVLCRHETENFATFSLRILYVGVCRCVAYWILFSLCVGEIFENGVLNCQKRLHLESKNHLTTNAMNLEFICWNKVCFDNFISTRNDRWLMTNVVEKDSFEEFVGFCCVIFGSAVLKNYSYSCDVLPL